MGPTDTYTIINVGNGTGGGLLKNPEPGCPSFWLAYVLVDNIGAATQKAKLLGATIFKDSLEVPGMGWLSIITEFPLASDREKSDRQRKERQNAKDCTVLMVRHSS